MNEIAAQCFIFFTAGFETSSTTINFCLYELANNPDIQDRLRNEIEDVVAKDGGELKYDTLLGMNYLDRVVSGKYRSFHQIGTQSHKHFSNSQKPYGSTRRWTTSSASPTRRTLRTAATSPSLQEPCSKFPSTRCTTIRSTSLTQVVSIRIDSYRKWPNPDTHTATCPSVKDPAFASGCDSG